PRPIHGTSWVTFRNRPEALLDEADRFIRARHRSVEHLLDTVDWGVACVVYVETDRIQHCLSRYISPDHPDYPELTRTSLAAKVGDMYRLLDECLGRLVERTTPEDLIVF